MKARAMKTKTIKASEFDEKFDAGEDVDAYLDWSKASRPNLVARWVNVDFPAWMVQSIDKEARRLGVTRQSLIKLWLADKLEHLSPS
jgi:CopG antitoxin of type II toxin-antitoxin system